MTLDTEKPPRDYHVMAKPIGPICNLDCSYCYYLEKESLYPGARQWKMPDDVLESFISQYIQQQDQGEITFAWQGGEPTLLGVEFFKKVVDLQRQFAGGKKIGNTLQTNGTLLDDGWCEFFAENHFLIGLSIDGPRPLHDIYRVDKSGKPTFAQVMRGVEYLQKHKASFNTLTVVNRANSERPLDVYRFLKQIGSRFLQFIPLVERRASVEVSINGLKFAPPPDPATPQGSDDKIVTDWSVEPRQYGEFLCDIFDEWVAADVGKVFVQLFDVALGSWMGRESALCVFAKTCGHAVALEHNGDVYSCDHYVYPQFRLGNVASQSLGDLLRSPRQVKFGNDKLDRLPNYCRQCSVRFACNGECPKHRFVKTPDGEEGLNYLCPAYKRFFNHIDPHMKTMAELLQHQRPAADIMRILASQPGPTATAGHRRNDLCPCGSGRKLKKCCGSRATSLSIKR